MSDSTSAKPELQRHTQPTHDAASESQRGFWALIATQFQGAFSDNVLRYLLLGIVVGTGISEDSGNRLVSVIMLLFSLAIHPVQHERRLSGRPLQQAQRDDWHQIHGNRLHADRHRRSSVALAPD